MGDYFKCTMFVQCDNVEDEASCYYGMNFYESKDNESKRRNRPRLNKYARDQKYKEHLRRLNNIFEGSYYASVYYVRGIWYGLTAYKLDKPYYKRNYRGKRSKYLKKLSNKKLRKYRKGISNNAGYRKVFDFWYELY